MESKKKKDRRHLGAVISTDREENFRPIPFWLDTLLFASCSYGGCGKTQKKKTQIKLRGYELSMWVEVICMHARMLPLYVNKYSSQ